MGLISDAARQVRGNAPVAGGRIAALARQSRLDPDEEPNNLERFLGETLQKVPWLQSVLEWAGMGGSAITNVASSIGNLVSGDTGTAGNRFASAFRNLGDLATLDQFDFSKDEDFRIGSQMLREAGIGKLGEVDLPIIGRVSGRGTLGLIWDVATDPLRFARLGTLTKTGRELSKTGGLARGALDDAGRISSRMARQAELGQRALLSARLPFSDNTLTLIKGSKFLESVDKARDYVAGSALGKTFNVKSGAALDRAQAITKAASAAGMSKHEFVGEMRKIWAAAQKAGNAVGMSADDMLERFIRDAEHGKLPIADVLDPQNTRAAAQAEDLARKNPIDVKRERLSRHETDVVSDINNREWYHGSGTTGLDVSNIDPLVGSHESLFGQGIYLTDNPRVATGYAKTRGRGRGREPTLYKARVKVNRVMDAERALEPRVHRAISGALPDELNNLWVDAARDATTFEDAFTRFRESVREYSHDNMIPTSEFAEAFQEINRAIVESGYDAIVHTGGLRMGGARGGHTALIVLDPNDVWRTGRSGSISEWAQRPLWAESTEAQAGREAQKKIAGALQTIKRVRAEYRQQGFSPAEANHAAKIVTLYNADPVMAPFASRFMRKFGDLLDNEIEAGIAITALTDDALYYLPRVLTTDARAFLDKHNLTDKAVQSVKRWSSKHPNAIRRNVIWEGKTIPEINALEGEARSLGFKGDFFETDPTKMVESRAARHLKASTQAKLFADTAETWGREVGDVDAALREGWVPVQDIAKKMGLKEKGPHIEPHAAKMVPPEVAQEMARFMEAMKNPGTPGTMMKLFDAATQNFKFGATALFPAFHIRNFGSAVWANFLGDMVNPGAYAKAGGLLRRLRTAPEEALTFGKEAITPAELMARGQAAHAFRAGAVSTRELPTFAAAGKVKKGIQSVANMSEDYPRIAMVIDRLEKGFSLDAAFDDVKKYHFDYGDLSQFEKTVMRRVVPFYTWSRKNIPLQLESLVTKPGKVATLKHFQDWLRQTGDGDTPVDQTIVPEWERERLFAIKKEGDKYRTISGIGVGFEDLAWLAAPGKEFLSMLNPILKAPLQQITNTDFFRQRPLDRSELAPPTLRYLEAIPGGKAFLNALDYRPISGAPGLYRANPRALNWIRGALSAGGVARAEQTFAAFDAPRAGGPEQASRFLTGIRTTTLDKEAAIRRNFLAVSELVLDRLQELQRQGVTSEITDKFYVRRDELVSEGPRAQEARDLLAFLRKMKKARDALQEAQIQATVPLGSFRSGGQ